MTRRPGTDRSRSGRKEVIRPRRTWPQRLLISFNLLMMGVALALAWLLNLSWERTASVNRVELAGALTPAEPREPGSRVLNILLVGSDSSSGLDEDNPINNDRVGERNGDVIIIAHLDERDGTAALLSLPRDLWVPIADTNREAKVNSAFAIGGPASLIETIEAAFDIPINYYVNIDLAGFEGLVDAVGTVDVFFDTPARDWNATHQHSQTGFVMEEAGCQPLDPPTALAYVRSRYYQTQDVDGRWVSDPLGDLGRIRRQQDFLQRLMQRAIDMGARNPFVLNELIDSGLDHVEIDSELTPQLLVDLGRTYASFEAGSLDTYSFPATFGRVGTSSVLFALDEEAAPILALFRGAPSTDPATVRVKVVFGEELSDEADGLVRALEGEGFELPGPSPADVAPGLVVRHGEDGAQAASVVADALLREIPGQSIRLEQVGGLLGRDVVVSLGAEDSATNDDDQASSPNTTVAVDTAANVAANNQTAIDDPISGLESTVGVSSGPPSENQPDPTRSIETITDSPGRPIDSC